MKLLDIHKTSRKKFEIEKGYQPYSSIFYILDGCFKIFINNKLLIVKKGDIIYLPKTIYFEREILSEVEFLYLRFTEDDIYFPFGGLLKVADVFYFEKTLLFLQEHQNDETSYMKNIFLESIFCQSLLYEKDTCNHADACIKKCVDYINTYYGEKITIDELSVLSGYSKTVFIQKFKKYYNTTPISYMNQLRMKKAREYLINTNLSVSEISALCGFNCPYYFSNSFSKAYGESPLKYRNNQKI